MAGAVSQFERMSFDDFEELLLDKPENERWELIGGRVIRGMVGARWEYGLIVQNIAFALRSHFKATGRPCRAFQETFYVKERSLDLSVLPDVVVRCGPIETGATSVSDPVVLAEVLSPGTAARDMFEKWEQYRQLPSLAHYLIVTRDKPRIEVKSRRSGDWDGTVLEGFHKTLELPALGFSMPLSDVYEDVLAP